jgi:hypothetical protein
VALPFARRHLEPLQLLDDGQQPGPPLGLRALGNVLPAGQKPHEVGDASRFDVPASPTAAGGVQTHQQVTGAPSSVGKLNGRSGCLETAQTGAGPLHRHWCAVDGAGRQGPFGHQLLHGDRSGNIEVPADALGHGIVAVDHRIAEREDHQLGPVTPFGGCPSTLDHTGPPGGLQLFEPFLPGGDRSAQNQGAQELVQFIGITRSGPRLLEDFGDGSGVKGAELGRVDR